MVTDYNGQLSKMIECFKLGKWLCDCYFGEYEDGFDITLRVSGFLEGA